jgi:siroheme synthase-like protein
MLDVTERPIVIVGGGAVAARKSRALIDCGATRIRVVAPQIRDEIAGLVERIRESYEPRHLDGASLVFAATDSPAVNAQVVGDARQRGILVNRADDAEPGGDFVTPARFHHGEVVIGVSAGSPALAAAIRDDVTRQLDWRRMKMAVAMLSLRPWVISRMPADRRAQAFRELADDEAIDLLDRGGEEALRDWMMRKYPELKP